MPPKFVAQEEDEDPFGDDWDLDPGAAPGAASSMNVDEDEDWGLEEDTAAGVISVPESHAESGGRNSAEPPHTEGSDTPTHVAPDATEAAALGEDLQQPATNTAAPTSTAHSPTDVPPDSPAKPDAPSEPHATERPATDSQPASMVAAAAVTAQSVMTSEPEEQPAEEGRRSGAGGWGGWGAGWGLGALGGTLKAVAVGAVRDVKGLAVSAQQALAEVESDTDGTLEDPAEQPAASPAPPKDRMVSGADDETTMPHAPSQQAVDRTAGEGQGSDLEDEDPGLDQLTTGAAKALSSLWGGISGVARNTAALVSKVEAATLEMVSGSGVSHDMAQLQAAAASSVRGVAVNVGRIGTRIEAGLETVGRTALTLLEEVTGQHDVGAGGSGRESSLDEELGEGVARGAGAQRSFEDLLDLYGGRQLLEDQENLANECARIANRARAKLEETQQAELDSVMASLGPVFSAALTPPPADWAPEDTAAQAWETMVQRYEPIQFLVQDSATRGTAFRELLLAAANEDLARLAKQTDAPAQAPGSAGKAASGAVATDSSGMEDATAEGSETRAATEGAAVPAASEVDASVHAELDDWGESDTTAVPPESQQPEAESLLLAALVQVRGHAFKRMAELVTAQLQLLADYGVNLAAPARTVDVQASNVVQWPVAPPAQAGLLRHHAEVMLVDAQRVAAGYQDAVQSVLSLVRPSTPKDSQVATEGSDASEIRAATPIVTQDHQKAIQLCEEVSQQVLAARKSSLAGLEEAFRSLLYAVLVRALVTGVAGDV